MAEALKYGHWKRHNELKDDMDAYPGYHALSANHILHCAMEKIFHNQYGVPGVLYTGSIFQAAIEWLIHNGGQPYMFNYEKLPPLLQLGLFKYTKTSQLVINKLDDPGSFGSAPINGRVININYKLIFDSVEKFANVYCHVTDAAGNKPHYNKWITKEARWDFAAWLLGAIILHEILHNHGAVHTNLTPPRKQGSEYARTLPVIADCAVIMCTDMKSEVLDPQSSLHNSNFGLVEGGQEKSLLSHMVC